MRKIKGSWFLFLFLLILPLSGCGKEPSAASKTETSEMKEIQEETNIPQISRIKSICELVTVECRYHNVAKSTKEAGMGVLHWGEKERIFWIEYTGIAEIGFQTKDIKMKQEGTLVTIILPKPYVSCKVDSASWTKDSYVISGDQWIQKNPITANDQTQAVREAQIAMEDTIRNNSTLLNAAEIQAKELIENYINQIGEATGITYTICFEDSETL